MHVYCMNRFHKLYVPNVRVQQPHTKTHLCWSCPNVHWPPFVVRLHKWANGTLCTLRHALQMHTKTTNLENKNKHQNKNNDGKIKMLRAINIDVIYVHLI